MTDEELIARLRVGVPTVWEKQAADRIEALVKERDQWIEHTKNAVWADSEELKMINSRAERLEAALKTARAYVENMARTWEHAQQDLAHIDTALKGADHE